MSYLFFPIFSDQPLNRRVPVAYSDGVYSMAGTDRPNPFDISWNTSQGQSGKPSFTGKTVFLTFFSKWCNLFNMTKDKLEIKSAQLADRSLTARGCELTGRDDR